MEKKNEWYEISEYYTSVNKGYKVNVKGDVSSPHGGYLTTSKNIKGYPYCQVNGKTVLIHRLIAMIFVPNPHNKPMVNHIDGNKKNFSIENLEWVTMKENFDHAVRIGLVDKEVMRKNSLKNGKHAGMLKAKKVRLLINGNVFGEFPTIIAAAQAVNITRFTAVRIMRGDMKSRRGITIQEIK